MQVKGKLLEMLAMEVYEDGNRAVIVVPKGLTIRIEIQRDDNYDADVQEEDIKDIFHYLNGNSPTRIKPHQKQ